MHKITHNFIESKLDPDFSKEEIEKIKELIDGSVTFTLSGMPGIGGSIFLRFLSLQSFAYFIYVDTYQLAEVNRLNYYQTLLKELGVSEIPDNEQQVLEKCRERLTTLTSENDRVVLILNRFDQLREYFSNQLFADLMSLRNIDLEKIVFIFTANKPYIEILPDDISADKVNLFSKTVYLRPYTKEDLRKLLTISGNATIHSDEFIDKAIELSGGHYQLLQLFLKSERLEPPFIDHFVKFQLKEIYDYLNYNQKQQIRKIALGKQVNDIDLYLLNVGMVKEVNGKQELFTPLFKEFINSYVAVKMPVKETRLFRLFKDNLGKVVMKDQIFEVVWKENPDEASDWALSSLLYRLRKHPTVTGQNYIIENHKKTGYVMLKG